MSNYTVEQPGLDWQLEKAGDTVTKQTLKSLR